TIPSQAVNGSYNVTASPTLSDLAGNVSDQDNDGVAGEAEDDVYTGSIELDRAALQVVRQTPSGAINGAITSIEIEFSAAILPSSFTALDVSIVGPSGSLAITAISQVSATVYNISFAQPTLEGTYSVTIGPEITDPGGTSM